VSTQTDAGAGPATESTPPIRPATLADVPELVELNDQLGYPTSERELSERLAPILGSREDAVLVALGDREQPIGWIHVAVERGLEASHVAGLRGLVVDEAHRSGGVGRALLRAAEAWARAHDCSIVTVRSRVARQRAHRFYEREGYVHVKTSHVFSKALV
jgi:GNAT superfamily N-acetyltransferase